MSEDAAQWVGVAVAVVFGPLGFVQAQRSGRVAKRANELAKTANSVATDAVGEAEKANQIAQAANQLSEQANTVVERAAAQQEEDWFVEWELDWTDQTGFLQLTNRGSDPAREVTVIVSGPDLHRVEELHHDVAASEHIDFTFPELEKQRVDHIRNEHFRRRSVERGGLAYTPRAFESDLEITVRWKTGLGFPRKQRFTQTVR